MKSPISFTRTKARKKLLGRLLVVVVVVVGVCVYCSRWRTLGNVLSKINSSGVEGVVEDGSQDNDELPKQPEQPLNILLLYADDWTYNMVGAMGNTQLKTPVLDQLAREGVLFTHNCVVSSICMQSRATLYTGQYPLRHRTYFAGKNITMYEEGRWNLTLYPLMMQAQYHVGFFGKYHHRESFPSDIPTFTHFKSVPHKHYSQRNGVLKHVTQWNEEDGLEFLDNRPRDRPFFLTISFFATHAEDRNPEQYLPMNSSLGLYQDTQVLLPTTYSEHHWQAMPHFFDENNVGRRRFRSRYNTTQMYQHHMKNTFRMVTEVDTACGNILSRLRQQGAYDNTLVIFTTDNGNSHGQHGLAEKWYAYEESLRVPLIIKDPRMPLSSVGTKNSDFTLNIDLAPTILTAAGISVPSVMQGRDMATLYLPTTDTTAPPKLPWRTEFLYQFHYNVDTIPNSVAWVTKDSKYIFWEDYNYSQYFNLAIDPLEEHDLFNSTDHSTIHDRKLRISQSIVELL